MENLREIVKEYSCQLAKLGRELQEIQFSYKVEDKVTREYWQTRIKKYEKYCDKALEYYNQVYAVTKIIDKDTADRFLLQISKFQHQNGALTESMHKVKETPSVINSKDKQQSLWSKKIKEDIIAQSDACLQHEKHMNYTFREFYDKHLREILQ